MSTEVACIGLVKAMTATSRPVASRSPCTSSPNAKQRCGDLVGVYVPSAGSPGDALPRSGGQPLAQKLLALVAALAAGALGAPEELGEVGVAIALVTVARRDPLPDGA